MAEKNAFEVVNSTPKIKKKGTFSYLDDHAHDQFQL